MRCRHGRLQRRKPRRQPSNWTPRLQLEPLPRRPYAAPLQTLKPGFMSSWAKPLKSLRLPQTNKLLKAMRKHAGATLLHAGLQLI